MLITALRFQTNFNFPTARVLSFRRIQPPQKLLYIYIYICCWGTPLLQTSKSEAPGPAKKVVCGTPTNSLLAHHASPSFFFHFLWKITRTSAFNSCYPQTLTAVDFISAVSTISVRRWNFRVELRFLSSISPYFPRLDAMVYSVLQVMLFCEHGWGYVIRRRTSASPVHRLHPCSIWISWFWDFTNWGWSYSTLRAELGLAIQNRESSILGRTNFTRIFELGSCLNCREIGHLEEGGWRKRLQSAGRWG